MPGKQPKQRTTGRKTDDGAKDPAAAHRSKRKAGKTAGRRGRAETQKAATSRTRRKNDTDNANSARKGGRKAAGRAHAAPAQRGTSDAVWMRAMRRFGESCIRSPDGAWAMCAVVEPRTRTDDPAVGRFVLKPPKTPTDRGATSGNGSVAKMRRLIGGQAATERLARMASALGHPRRLVILARLLIGGASYRDLAQTTAQKAGPLYHHLRELEFAGLIRRPKRDAYALTRAGRNAILVLAAMGGVTKDTRPVRIAADD